MPSRKRDARKEHTFQISGGDRPPSFDRLSGRRIYALSHIGHLVERTHDELALDAAELGMIVAYDGFTVNI